jgi:hypothetical protein
MLISKPLGLNVAGFVLFGRRQRHPRDFAL